jgi:hypothetical protein
LTRQHPFAFARHDFLRATIGCVRATSRSRWNTSRGA